MEVGHIIATLVLLSAQPVTADSLLRGELLNLQSIDSIEFTVVTFTEPILPPVPKGAPIVLPPAARASRREYSFLANGAYYRVTVADGDTTAFDGKMYQARNDVVSVFDEKETPPANIPQVPFPDPIKWTYYWAMPYGEFRSFNALQSGHHWDELISNARIASSDGDSHIVELSRMAPNGKEYLYSISFGPDGHVTEWTSFLMPAKTTSNFLRVTETHSYRDSGGKEIWLPLKVQHSGQLEGETEMIPQSVLVNHDVDPDRFVISPIGVMHNLSAPPQNPIRPVSPAKARTWRVFVLFNVLGLCGIVAWLLFRRRKST